MMSIVRPGPERVAAVVADQAGAPLTYEQVGATMGEMPRGWSVDEQHQVVGRGEEAFQRAVAGLRRWVQFDLGWVTPVRADVPLTEGALFAFVAWTLGVWSVNVCRIVAVVDERDDQGARFGFAYGTVGAHSVRGEERFLVAWDRATDEVTFGIRKFSRPAGLLVRALGPVARWIQARFTREALDRLAHEVAT